jgi:hypothetical protein
LHEVAGLKGVGEGEKLKEKKLKMSGGERTWQESQNARLKLL